MSFERKSMEYLVNRMITWTQGVSTKLTDFRIGSKIRTIYEAVAVVIEEQYDSMYRALKQLIEENLYAMMGFDKIPASYASGLATFSRSTPADQDYIIPAGTSVLSKATEYNAPMKFYTTEDAVLAVGTTFIKVLVVCETPGVRGNIAAETLTTFVQKPLGVEEVTNMGDFESGKEEETRDEQKGRFQDFVKSQARGVLQAIEYGAKLAKRYDSTTGNVMEEVLQAKAFEDLVNKRGQVDLYIWTGGLASNEIKAEVDKLMLGYTDSDGNPVYGYKPAGVSVNIYSASRVWVRLRLQVTPESTTTLDELKPRIESELNVYFSSLKLGQTVVQSAVQANIARIDGVQDAKLYMSLDNGATWSMDNVTTAAQEIAYIDTITYI